MRSTHHDPPTSRNLPGCNACAARAEVLLVGMRFAVGCCHGLQTGWAQQLVGWRFNLQGERRRRRCRPPAPAPPVTPARAPSAAHQFQQALQLRLVSCQADPTQQGGGLVQQQLGAVGVRLPRRLGARLHGCGRHAACECPDALQRQLLDALRLCLASGGAASAGRRHAALQQCVLPAMLLGAPAGLCK
jgi:hypothetical protein